MNILFKSNNLTKSWFKIIKIPSSRTDLLNISQQLLPRRKTQQPLSGMPEHIGQVNKFQTGKYNRNTVLPVSPRTPRGSPVQQETEARIFASVSVGSPQNMMAICCFCCFKGSCKSQVSSKKLKSNLSLTSKRSSATCCQLKGTN